MNTFLFHDFAHKYDKFNVFMSIPYTRSWNIVSSSFVYLSFKRGPITHQDNTVVMLNQLQLHRTL